MTDYSTRERIGNFRQRFSKEFEENLVRATIIREEFVRRLANTLYHELCKVTNEVTNGLPVPPTAMTIHPLELGDDYLKLRLTFNVFVGHQGDDYRLKGLPVPNSRKPALAYKNALERTNKVPCIKDNNIYFQKQGQVRIASVQASVELSTGTVYPTHTISAEYALLLPNEVFLYFYRELAKLPG